MGRNTLTLFRRTKTPVIDRATSLTFDFVVSERDLLESDRKFGLNMRRYIMLGFSKNDELVHKIMSFKNYILPLL